MSEAYLSRSIKADLDLEREGLMMTQMIEAYRTKLDWEHKRSALTTQQKREAKGYLVGTFKEKNCFLCHEPLMMRLLYSSYTIHHEIKIGLPFCNLLPNLHLAHFGCNSRAGPAKSIQKQKERNNMEETMNPTAQLREVVDYSQGSAEMQANNHTEVPFAAWLKKELLNKGYLEYKIALDKGAYFMGCGQQAIRRYLDKLIAGGEISSKKDLNTKKRIVKLTVKGEERF